MMLTFKQFLIQLIVQSLLAVSATSLADGKIEPLVPAEVSTNGPVAVFPDVPGYLTVTADLHTHSAFSDGHVWPNLRVAEALREGVDALAITEHLEWQPHSADLPHPNRNRAYDIAAKAAEDETVLVVPGAEITRDPPVGHINAVFIQDANKLLAPAGFEFDQDAVEAIAQQLPDWGSSAEVNRYYATSGLWPVETALKEARDQGAFVFWNHPSWVAQAPDGKPIVSEAHLRWFEQGLIAGVEIANSDHYSPEAFRLALKHNLTLLGTSDVHGLIDWDYPPSLNQHRPLTLIFAKQRTNSSLREALLNGRTVVWYRDTLLGRDEYLRALILASISVKEATYLPGSTVLRLVLENRSSVPFQLENISDYGHQTHSALIDLPALRSTVVELSTGKHEAEIKWPVRAQNALVAPGKPIEFSVIVTIEQPSD